MNSGANVTNSAQQKHHIDLQRPNEKKSSSKLQGAFGAFALIWMISDTTVTRRDKYREQTGGM